MSQENYSDYVILERCKESKEVQGLDHAFARVVETKDRFLRLQGFLAEMVQTRSSCQFGNCRF